MRSAARWLVLGPIGLVLGAVLVGAAYVHLVGGRRGRRRHV